jgi:hypothetical protein
MAGLAVQFAGIRPCLIAFSHACIAVNGRWEVSREDGRACTSPVGVIVTRETGRYGLIASYQVQGGEIRLYQAGASASRTSIGVEPRINR